MRDRPITSTFESLRSEQQRRAIVNHLVSGGYVQSAILQWHIQVYATGRNVSYEQARDEIKSLAREQLENKLAQL